MPPLCYVVCTPPPPCVQNTLIDQTVCSSQSISPSRSKQWVRLAEQELQHFLPGLGSKLDSVSTTVDDQIKVANSKLSGIGLELKSAQRDIEALRASSALADTGAETEAVFRRISELESKLADLSLESEALQREIIRCKLKDSSLHEQVGVRPKAFCNDWLIWF